MTGTEQRVGDWLKSYGRWSEEVVERPKLNVALIQMNAKEKAREENVRRACEFIDTAAKAHADLIILPEFFEIEYFFFGRDYSYVSCAEPETGPTISAIKEKAKEHGVHIMATIYEEAGPGLYFDSTIVITPGAQTLGKYRKTHPSAVSSLEKIYFKRGSRFPVFKISDWKVGVSICYDNLFPEATRVLAVKGAELIVMPFATPYYDMWEKTLMMRAFDNLCYVAVCNKVGMECGYTFGGNSMIVSSYGEVLQRASGDKDEVIIATLDLKHVYEARRRYPTFRDRRPEIYGDLSSFEEDVRDI